jgi:alanine dehydrogenase
MTCSSDGAGGGIDFEDADYRAVGATIVGPLQVSPAAT